MKIYFTEVQEDSVLEEKEPTKKTPEEIRSLWKKAILETLLLIRMEKENTDLLGKRRGRSPLFYYNLTHN